MTMTEARPEADAPADEAPQPDELLAARFAEEPTTDGLIDTADSRRLGLVYVVVSLLAFLGARAIGAVLGAELMSKGVTIVGNDSLRLYSLYDGGLPLAFLIPFWLGLGTAIVPLQIGASRLAFPRAQAYACWLHVLGVALWVGGQVGNPLPGLGLSSVSPLQAPPGGVNKGTDLFLASLIVLALATLVASANLVATVATQRAEGMTLIRMPLFAWATTATAVVTLLSTPVFLGGASLLYLDLHFGGTSLFGAKGALIIWQKMLWLYGRPEIFLLVLPALGVAGDVVLTATRGPIFTPPAPPGAPKPPRGHILAAGCIVAFGFLSLFTWTAHVSATRSLIQPTSTLATALILAPVGLLALLLLGTLGNAKAKPTLAVGFVAGFFLLVAAAAAVGLWNLLDTKGTGSAAAYGTIELGVLGAPTVLAFGALYHWGAKLFGRPLLLPAGGLVLLTSVAGSLAVGVGNAVAGHAGAAAHIKDYANNDYQAGFVLVEAGQVLLLIAGLILLLDIVRAFVAARSGALEPDLDDGVTLEWAAASPPPLGNFTLVPEVRSETPLLEIGALSADAEGGA